MAKKAKPIYKNITFDSHEEIWVYKWLEEAVIAGFVESFAYQPVAFDLISKKSYSVEVELKTKTKTVDKHLLHEHIYTADYSFVATEKLKKLNHKMFSHDDTYLIDVKPSFQRFGGDRSFSINQKLVYDKYQIFINKVIPQKLFELTWVPKNVKIGKSGKTLGKYNKCKTISQLLLTI